MRALKMRLDVRTSATSFPQRTIHETFNGMRRHLGHLVSNNSGIQPTIFKSTSCCHNMEGAFVRTLIMFNKKFKCLFVQGEFRVAPSNFRWWCLQWSMSIRYFFTSSNIWNVKGWKGIKLTLLVVEISCYWWKVEGIGGGRCRQIAHMAIGIRNLVKQAQGIIIQDVVKCFDHGHCIAFFNESLHDSAFKVFSLAGFDWFEKVIVSNQVEKSVSNNLTLRVSISYSTFRMQSTMYGPQMRNQECFATDVEEGDCTAWPFQQWTA